MNSSARSYVAALGTRVAALAQAQADLASGAPEAVEAIRRLSHVLRGSGSTFGYPQLTVASTAVEVADPADLPAALERLLTTVRAIVAAGADGTPPSLILVVEDDPVTLLLLQSALAAPNCRVVTAPTIEAAEWHLQHERVSLVILDLVMPDGDGRNFLIRMREQPHTATTPIIVVSAVKSARVRTECFALGCDAYMTKPVETEVLAAAAVALLARTERAEQDTLRDALTGLANRAGVRDLFVRMSATAERDNRPSAVALIKLDGFKALNDRYGHAGGDAALRTLVDGFGDVLRETDILGRWSGDEFVILMPDTDTAVGFGILSSLLEQVRSLPVRIGEATVQVTFTCGVATCQVGGTLDDVISDASGLVYHGKSAGGGVVLTDAKGVTAIRHTVLLAEDDRMVAALIKHRLQRNGFDVVHTDNGAEALALADQTRIAMAILDVNMPGMNGFDVLMRLRERKTLIHTPIMMLTSLGSEADISRALELGADDYMIKPFSPVELLARVRRLVSRT